MGVFHFKLVIIPRSAPNPGALEPGDDDPEWPPDRAAQPTERLLRRLRRLLPQNESWGTAEEYASENEWGSKLTIWHVAEPRTEASVESIVFQFGPVGDPVSLLETVTELVADENCKFYSREFGTTIDPAFDAVCDYLRQSRAISFAKDPKEVLRQIDQNPIRHPQFLDDNESDQRN